MDFGKYIAHRGLHSELVPENSLTAFRLAVEKCLSIELDVRLTKDCRIVVFHDNDLMRMCGIEGKVFDYTYEQLSAFKLKNSDEKIPLLSEVLKTVDGKVPLLIELKGGAPFGELESRVDHMMKKYKGEFAVQSFNPFSVMWFRFHSPKVTRGQLVSKYRNEQYDDLVEEIYKLREEKQQILADKAEMEGVKQSIFNMKAFLNSQTAEIEEYDEQLVRRLIAKVTVFDDKFEVELKSGLSVDIQRSK